MKKRTPNLHIIVLVLILLLFTGCSAFIGRYGQPFYSGQDHHYFERLIYNSQTQLDDTFSYRLPADDELRVVGDESAAKDQALKAPLLLRFAWFSDVQIRQREVKLFSDEASLELDAIISSFEHNFVQEDFDWAVYLSLMAATNRLHQEKPLDFMIHTGDGIDAGTIEELYQFIYISDRLQMPWLNLAGNHDVAIFGNYRERVSFTRQAGVNFYPVGNVDNFVWMHRKERKIAGFGRRLLPTPSEFGHSPSEDTGAGKKLPPTFHHGFDLSLDQGCGEFPPKNLDYEAVTGYYAADLCQTAIPLRLIAMNTAKTMEWGADAHDDNEQRTWLQKALLPRGQGLNLVFSHHRPQGFDAQTKQVLSASGLAPVIVFTGHTHQHHLARHEGLNGQGYYELNTGSVLEYPQIGRLIELRGSPQGPVWLVSRALWNSLIPVGDMPSQAEVEAVLNECLDQREAKRANMAEAVQCGHLGALEDYLSNAEQAWGRPQPFSEGWNNANVIVPIRR
ncbi:MAG: metallophosphoesterase [Desulfohalobiaceae bacterium]|nr:metallophosphoesterase [Desulfohalobiaceae bacterium]